MRAGEGRAEGARRVGCLLEVAGGRGHGCGRVADVFTVDDLDAPGLLLAGEEPL